METIFFETVRRLFYVSPQNIPKTRPLVRLCRVAAGLIASSLSFTLLNVKDARPQSSKTQINSSQPYTDDKDDADVSQAGQTLDFTLLISVRAMESLIGKVWRQYQQPRLRQNSPTSNVLLIGRLADPAVFVISAGIVMWTWFYYPKRLPRAYQKWIGEAASVDERLVQTLRKCRNGEFIYGKDTGQAQLLQRMCTDYNWPLAWGDPTITIPVPCEMVHMGTGPSCHYHALSRFWRAFKFSMIMYLPIQLILKMRKPSTEALINSIREAARSSAFLGSFISLFYYSVCLSRTVLGPRLFSYKTITPQMWDSGICVGAGCVACGMSIFLEKPRRRPELAFFVAPRAAAVFLPRRYDTKYLWRERLAFAMSTATLLAMFEENPKNARGLISFVLFQILA